MFDGNRSVRGGAFAACAGLALALAGCAAEAGSADGPVRCEIRQSQSAGMTQLEAVVHANKAVTGSYQFKVDGSGGGSAQISQGGEFEAGPGEPTVVGTVTVSSSVYQARLEIMPDGERGIGCALSS